MATCQETLNECDKTVEKCRDALEARKKEVHVCNLGLVQMVDENAHLTKVVEEKNEQLDAWYRNPFVTIPLGIAAGVLLIEVVK